MVAEGALTVTLAWNARGGEGFPAPTGRWTVADEPDFAVTLDLFSVSESQDRIVILNTVNGEVAALFPKGGSRLDPDRVEGLELAST